MRKLFILPPFSFPSCPALALHSFYSIPYVSTYFIHHSSNVLDILKSQRTDWKRVHVENIVLPLSTLVQLLR
jgi:hypothetical protein